VVPRSRHLPAAVFESLFLFGITAAILVYCLWEGGFQPTDRLYIKDVFKPTPYLDEILKQRELTLITRNTTQGYYTYQGRAMGFEYELAEAFADFIGVRLRVVTAESWQEMSSELAKTPTGILAAGLGLSAAGNTGWLYSDSYQSCLQHIVVHRDNQEIRSPQDLAGRRVHIGKGSGGREILERYRTRGIDFEIVEDGASMEELIQRVAEKSIDVTIAWHHVALRSRRYFPQIVLGEAVSETPVPMGWVVDSRAEGLLHQINLFFDTVRNDGTLQEIFDRYYTDEWEFDFVGLRAFHRRLKSRLPKYQEIVKSAAADNGFDWRLIAAQMYQESHYNYRARSNARAYGLMQLTRRIASYFGVSEIYDPEENIRGGLRYLKFLYEYFDDAEGMDRICIALAAYNIGQGHILDAQAIAEELDLDPNQWSSVSQTLPLLSQREYYRHSKYGFCRGEESVTYVKQTLLYYDILKYMDMPWVKTKEEANGVRQTADG
jgi:membrane-bound lytic murein transglycosylase F